MPPSPIFLCPDPDQVYHPAEDSFLLLRAAEKEVTAEDRVLEVGVGSGYISSRLPPCRIVVGTDINPHAVKIAYYAGIQMIRTDLTAGLIDGSFDLILFNPPYLPTSPSERINDWLEYALDGGQTGRDVIARFLDESPRLLTDRGRVLLLVSSLNGLDEIHKLIQLSGWECGIVNQETVEGAEILYICRLTVKRFNN